MHFYSTDIDECSLEIDNCTQICLDTQGSYSCSCRDGYTLDSDGRDCNGTFTDTSCMNVHDTLELAVGLCMCVACSQMWMSVHWAMTSVIRPATTPLAATRAAVALDTPLMSMAADVMVCGG